MRNVPDTFFTPITTDTDKGLIMLLDAYDQKRIPEGKVTDDHVARSQSLQRVATLYVQAVQSSNSFLTSLQSQLRSKRTLSTAQARGALNVLLRDYAELQKERGSLLAKTDDPFTAAPVTLQEAPAPEQQPSGPVTPVIVDGIYTVVLDEAGTYRTLRFKTCDLDQCAKYRVPMGTQIVSYLSGADNDSAYTGFGYVFGNTFKAWKSFTKAAELHAAVNFMLVADKDTRIDYGHAYALQSGRCFICNRRLTVPASINRGMGPDCASKY